MHSTVGCTYFALKKRAFEEDQGLPFELMDEFAERYAEIMLRLTFLVFQQSWETLFKSL